MFGHQKLNRQSAHNSKISRVGNELLFPFHFTSPAYCSDFSNPLLSSTLSRLCSNHIITKTHRSVNKTHAPTVSIGHVLVGPGDDVYGLDGFTSAINPVKVSLP